MEAAQDEICVLCGAGFRPEDGKPVSEGTACASCAGIREGSLRNGGSRLVWIALFAALVPVCFAYVTTTEHSNAVSSVAVTTRVLIFASTNRPPLR